MPFSDEEKKRAILDQNKAINEFNREHSGFWDRFRGRVPLKTKIFELREKD